MAEETSAEQPTAAGDTPSPEGPEKSPVENPVENPPGEEVTPDWREDWREAFAGEDEKALRYFRRYSSPENVGKALLSLRSKMDSGELLLPMPDPKDEEAIKAWREDNGVPNELDGYFEGYEAEDDFKEMAAPYIELAHQKGLRPADVHEMLDVMKAQNQQVMDEISTRDVEFKRESEDELRAKYGPEYRANMNHMANIMVPLMGEELFEDFTSARLPDGRKLADDHRVLDMLVEVSRKIQDIGTIVPPSDEAAVTAMKQRKAEIENTIRMDNAKYYADPAMQQEYQEILMREEKLEANRR